MRRSLPLVMTVLMLIVTTPGALATFPGENGRVVFQAETDDGTQLFTMEPDGTDVRQVTHVVPIAERDSPGATAGDWSPDGRTLVFAENQCQIALVDPDGSDLRELPTESGYEAGVDICEGDPSFTSDGTSILYGRFDPVAGVEEIWSQGIDGSDRHKVTDACGIDPNASPDGTFLSCKGKNGALWVVNMDGSDPVQVSPTEDIGYHHDWAPDSTKIVFVHSADKSPSGVNIATVAPDGSGLTNLTDYTDPDLYPGFGSYSPDGTSVIYRIDRGDDEHAVFVMNADGSDVRQVTDFSDFSPRHMDWGPAPAE